VRRWLAVLAVGKFELRLGIEALQTISVVAIVYGCQTTNYAIRERRHFLGLRPTIWLVSSSVADILIISILGLRGIAMAPLPISVIACEFAAVEDPHLRLSRNSLEKGAAPQRMVFQLRAWPSTTRNALRLDG
jgi:hypothetical protein